MPPAPEIDASDTPPLASDRTEPAASWTTPRTAPAPGGIAPSPVVPSGFAPAPPVFGPPPAASPVVPSPPVHQAPPVASGARPSAPMPPFAPPPQLSSTIGPSVPPTFPPPAVLSSAPQPAPPKSRLRPIVWAIGAAVLVVFIAVVITGVFLARRWLSSPPREGAGVAVTPTQSPSGGVPKPEVKSPAVTGIDGKTLPAAPRAAPAHPGTVSALVLQSRLVRRVDPVYPEFAKRSRIEGSVYLRITVNENGRVSRAEVIRGHPLLTQSALDAVRQWKYTPTLLHGRAVPVNGTVVIHYKLH